MRKEALVSSVFSALLVPERLEELLYVIDDETWTLFQTAYKEEFISLSGRLPDNFMLLKELCYLVQEPNSYEQIVYMTGEIKVLFAELISGGFLHRRQYYNELHTYALAAVNLYGVIAKTDFVEIYNLQNEQQTSIDEVCAVLPRYIEVGAPYCFWKDYIQFLQPIAKCWQTQYNKKKSRQRLGKRTNFFVLVVLSFFSANKVLFANSLLCCVILVRKGGEK